MTENPVIDKRFCVRLSFNEEPLTLSSSISESPTSMTPPHQYDSRESSSDITRTRDSPSTSSSSRSVTHSIHGRMIQDQVSLPDSINRSFPSIESSSSRSRAASTKSSEEMKKSRSHSTPSAGESQRTCSLSQISKNEWERAECREEESPMTVLDAPGLCNLIVNYLPPLMDEHSLFFLFSQFGPILKTKIIYDKVTGESMGYGFITYECFFSATFALNNLNGYEIAGKMLKVSYSNRPAAEIALAAIKNLPASQQKFSEQHKQILSELYRQQRLVSRQAQKSKDVK